MTIARDEQQVARTLQALLGARLEHGGRGDALHAEGQGVAQADGRTPGHDRRRPSGSLRRA